MKYYWIKLRTDFFNQDTIDFLLSQKNGCEYVVLYQMLCLNTANLNGTLATQMGEVIVPYNIEKIVRDTKYFDYDTIVVALELYKQIGLIYVEEDGNLKITDIERMIGSESATREAIKKREQRLKKKLEGTQVGTKCLTDIDIRDKRLDIRDKDIDIDIINDDDDKEVEDKNIIDYFNNNFHCIVQKEYEELTNWEKTFSDDVILYAMDLSIMNNVRTMNYISSILRNWKEKGYKTLEECKNDKKPADAKKEHFKKENIVPSWVDKEIKREEISDEELAELEKEFEIFN